MRSHLLLSAVAALATATGAAAQGAHPVAVTPHGGYIVFPSSSGIQNAAFIGVDAQYKLTSSLSVGATLSTSRPKTNGDDFIAALTYTDTTFLYTVVQPLNIFDAGAIATLHRSFGSLTPFVNAAVGAYKIYLDPQAVDGSKSFSRMFIGIGGGAEWEVSKSASLQFGLTDHMYQNFDRERLRPTAARFANTRFVEDVPTAPASSKTLHNLMFSVGFSYTPSLGGTGTEGGNR
jgi:hypothetical protein